MCQTLTTLTFLNEKEEASSATQTSPASSCWPGQQALTDSRLQGKKLLFVGFGLHTGYRSCLRVMCLNPPKWTALQFSIPRIPAAC